MLKKLIISIWLVTLVCTLGISTVQASQFRFAVNPITPDNQVDTTKSYFDLKMDPGQSQTIEVELRNDSDEEVEVGIEIAPASTNLNGVVEYGLNDIIPDESLRYNLTDLVEVEDSIVLPKESTTVLRLAIQMPDTSFDGLIAGGITFKEIDDSDAETEEEQGMTIKNEYSYVVALLLRQNLNEVSPTLNLTNVEAGQVNARNVINATFRNEASAYLNQLRLINQVTKENESDVLYASDQESMQVAPNSQFTYPISLNGERLEPGTYHFASTAYGIKSDEGEYEVENEAGEIDTYMYKWEFDQTFEITAEVARTLNAADVTIEDDITWMYIVGGIVFLLIGLLLLLIYRKKKNKE